jgi:hypothetical protein
LKAKATSALSRIHLILATTLVLWASAALAAHASESAKISATFKPERLGAPTTATLGFQLASVGGRLPSPLTGIDFRYPTDLGIATSGLGLASCDPAGLEAHGPAVCPPNSVMGYGSASVEVPLGPEIVRETAKIVLVAGPSRDGHLNLLVSATGLSPVAARIVMPTLLLSGHLHIGVPLVPSLPEGPPVAVVRVQVTLGGRPGGRLTYYEQAHGRTVAYHPKGIGLPRRCPSAGFEFAATFSFLDGTRTSAHTAVPCPKGS